MNFCNDLDQLREALGQDIPDDDVVDAAVKYITQTKQRVQKEAHKAIRKTTGWAIVHPDGWVEMDYFSHGMSNEELKKFRPGCTCVHVGLVVEEK